MNNFIGIDWLSFFGYADSCEPSRDYDFEPLGKAMAWDEVVAVKHNGRVMAYLCRHPHSPAIGADSGVLKIANEILYLTYRESIIEHLMKSIGFQPRSISRIDVFCDNVTFGSYPRASFIRDFLSEKFIKMGRCSAGVVCRSLSKVGIKQYGTGYFCIEESKVMARVGRNLHYTYMCFGSRSSDVKSYIYNKSLELEEVHLKKYIQDGWRACGWDGRSDVWRVELSLQGSRVKVIDQGEDLLYPWQSVFANSARIFHGLRKKYFDIRLNQEGVRKDRLPVALEWGCDVVGSPTTCRVSSSSATTLADKAFVRRLHKAPDEMYFNNDDFRRKCNEVGKEFVNAKGLQAWCVRNGIDFSQIDYQTELTY